MPTKTTKKTTTKATTAKKPATKKVAQPKVAKVTKSAPKSAPKAVKKIDVATPCMEPVHGCHCGADCKCGDNCKCHGSKFGRFVKKLIIALILLALGFAAAKICCCHKSMRGPRVQFADNGCMVEESVKCPKMLEMLPAMDINQDGCITHDEYREFKHQMRQGARDAAPVEESAEVVEVSVDAE